MLVRICITVFALFIAVSMAAANGVTSNHEDMVVIKAAQIITGTGDTIDNGTIVVVDGEIAAIGRDVDYPPSARVIDAQQQTVMPGLIHLRTRQGLPNYSRSGIQSQHKVSDELYLSLIDFEDMLRAGFTTACYIPGGVGLPGQAANFRTGGNDADRVMNDSAYLRITMTNPARDKRVFRDALSRAKAEIEKIKQAREEWEKKQEEETKKSEQNGDNADDKDNDADAKEPAEFQPPQIDDALRAIVEWIQGENDQVGFIEMSSPADLLHTDDVLSTHKDLPVIYFINPGAGGFDQVVERLGERNALVVTGPNLTTLPNTVVRYNLVAALFNAGAEVALLPSGSPDRMRPMIADLARSGLDHEQAIRAITTNAARVLGLEDRIGSIAPGKDADLIFLDGHPLDGHSKVQRTMIRGQIVWTDGEDS